MTAEETPVDSPTKRVLAVVLFNLLVYIVIGLPNAVLTIFVSKSLGYSTLVAGATFSLQYFATFAARPSAGRLVDRIGPKPVVVVGLIVCALSGVLMTLSGPLASHPFLSLGSLLCSRLLLGWAESWAATGVIVWNIRRAGSENTAVAISWNGICSYGGMAMGAPIGGYLARLPHPFGSMTGVGILSTLLPLFGLSLIGFYKGVLPTPSTEKPVPFSRALRLVLPHGSALAAGSIGFGAISSFLALYYSDLHWEGAARTLAIFGIVFVCVRFFFSDQIGQRGGVVVAIVSLLIEAAGLATLAIFRTPAAALVGAALTGAGFSLLFPALGVLAVNRAGAQNRGAALGAYSIFIDLAIACSGLFLGQLIEFAGYRVMFATTAFCCLAGVLISRSLARSST